MTPLLAILIVYSIALIGVGAWIGRRVRTSNAFFVGNRSLGAALIFATFLAPNIGAGSTVGATALAYQDGAAAWWWVGSAGFGSLVLAFWLGPRMWREATRLNLLTVGDFLEHRFGSAARGVAAAVIWCGTLNVLVAQLDGAATVLGLAGGLPHAWGCLAAVGVMTTYFVVGGLAGAARVNGLQLIVKLAGFAIALPLALAAAGGWPHVASVNAARMNLLASPPGAGWPLIFLLGPGFFLSPGLLQKAFGARDERTLTTGVALNGLALLIFAIVPVGLGVAARVLHPALANADYALATLLTHDVPFAVGGLALAAVFSAEMSAADAVLFMLSTSGARDLYKGFFKRDASDAEVLRAARVAAVLGATLAYGLTFVYPSVVGALKLFYGLLVVTLFAPILGGLFLPRGGRAGALASMAAGVSVLAVISVMTDGAGYAWMSPAFLGLIASAATYLAVAAIKPSP